MSKKKQSERFNRIGGVSSQNSKRNPAMEQTKSASNYGEKAAKDFDGIRGKAFKHAKNKKKRGSYKGGKIDMKSNSIKFENSDGE